jgi:prepilin-type N-terminal cleavage/methylation domain-containing protein
MTCLLGNRSNHRPHDRRGVTLVELLIVIGITSLIAAVALPSVKTLLKDRKTNQAAIQVRGFIESAKAMAIAKGREVAVVLDRMSDSGDYNPAANNWFSTEARDLHRNTVLRLSLAEVLPPYTGDLDNSTCILELSDSQAAAAFPQFNRALININQNPSLARLIDSKLIDKIAFSDRMETFEVLVDDCTYDLSTGIARIEYINSRTASRAIVNRAPSRVSAGPHTFRIYCKPRRLYAKPMQLPKGTCIDMSLSGRGVDGFSFSAQQIEAFDPKNTLGVNQVRPIYLVFDSQGAMASLYGNFSGQPAMTKVLPTSDVYLLVGKTDKVVFPGATFNNTTLYQASNLADSTSYWVKVSASGGQVSMAPVLAPSLTPGVGGAVSLSTALTESRGAAQASVDLSAR